MPSLNMVKIALRICHAARPTGLRSAPALVRARTRCANSQRQSCEAPAISDDLKLFASTFLVGFVFVSVLLGLAPGLVAGEVKLPAEPRRDQAHRRDQQ